ncbi:hypothetical protein L9W86_06090 [Vibrio aestuarianus]|nr:hypothetical protein [Vibrio aestuarianus]MDE1209633.1 hypothetical protein [Vibrio aestuarianus]
MKKRTLICSALLATLAIGSGLSAPAMSAETATTADSTYDFRQETIYLSS